MDTDLLRKHIRNFAEEAKAGKQKFTDDIRERQEYVNYYRNMTAAKIRAMDAEGLYEYISKLWAMLIWGNKHYVVDKLIEDNGLDNLLNRLTDLIWSDAPFADRWDSFRKNVKGMGPAMISELLCKTHPEELMLWNRRAYVGLNYLKVQGLPRYDYQLTGKLYMKLCGVCKKIAEQMKKAGLEDTTLLAVDYFIWNELQVEDNLSNIYARKEGKEPGQVPEPDPEVIEFVHDDIRDKLRDIGQWLGFEPKIEQKVADGSKVDAVWEATIGNMGRVIYVFEVQTKGSIDSLILNLLKSLNNPAVQGVVAVSDKAQLERIRKHASAVRDLRDKLKYWDYQEISQVHESLEFVNTRINALDLVPQGF